MFYAGDPGSPPTGTIIRDASGRQLRFVVGFDPVTGEVIDHRQMVWLRWLNPGWVSGSWANRHWFAPAPISFEVPSHEH